MGQMAVCHVPHVLISAKGHNNVLIYSKTTTSCTCVPRSIFTRFGGNYTDKYFQQLEGDCPSKDPK